MRFQAFYKGFNGLGFKESALQEALASNPNYRLLAVVIDFCIFYVLSLLK